MIPRYEKFPIVTEEEFPFGIRCIRCLKEIEPGTPYKTALDEMDDDGEWIEELTCVYC